MAQAGGDAPEAPKVPPPPTGDEKRVVIAVDASPQAEMAVQFYIDNLHHKTNHVVILHVVELPDVADMGNMRQMYMSPHSIADMWKEQSAKSNELEIKFSKMLRHGGVEHIRCKVEGGMKPGHVIVNVATEEHATMVIMGTRGMGKLRRTLVGSVSDYVVHHAHCPVVVCRN